MEARNIIPLTAARHRRSCRGNTTEQFKSVWMKFNPHSSPPPICRLIYSQVHSAAVSEEAADNKPGEHKSIRDVIHSTSVPAGSVAVDWSYTFSSDFVESDSHQGQVQARQERVLLFSPAVVFCCFEKLTI